MKENRLFAVMTVLAISASSVFGQFKIYNSELLKIGNVNEQAKITRGFEVSMPEVLMQAGNTGIRFAEGKVRIGNGVGTGNIQFRSLHAIHPDGDIECGAVFHGIENPDRAACHDRFLQDIYRVAAGKNPLGHQRGNA